MRPLLLFAALLVACDSDAFTVPSAGVLVASTDRMDFGEVRVGASVERKVRLTNAGGRELSIVATTIDQTLGAFAAGAPPRTLAGGASAELTVTFAPRGVGAHGGTLTIVTNAEGSSTLRIELAGDGVDGVGDDGGVEPDGGIQEDGGSVDADAGVEPDTGIHDDAAIPADTGIHDDAESVPADTGIHADAAVPADSGIHADAAPALDASTDAGTPDSGPGVWTPTALTNAPTGRDLHGAVWTGTQMVVFGARGGPGLTDGARYDPATDAWSPVSSAGAPSFHTWGQNGPTLVWTGTEIVAWNGYVGGAPQGGRYNPATNTWRAMSATSQPGPRRLYPVVWTGTEMIVWGGCDQLSTAFPDGARYDPALDRWTPMSTTGAPAARCAHTAVWTGTEMVVWGGLTTGGIDVANGGRYDPATNTWAPMSSAGAPSARRSFSGVWTGAELIVFGGSPTNGTGGRYAPATDTWTPLPTIGAPSPRQHHTAIWTGAAMIVWGGHDSPTIAAGDTGAAYDPIANRWTPTTLTGAPAGRYLHTAVWTGVEMIVWGGADGASGYHRTGGRYRP